MHSEWVLVAGYGIGLRVWNTLTRGEGFLVGERLVQNRNH